MKLARERRRLKSAIKIQSSWRGFIAYSTYLIRRYETQAAITIQAYWRRYWQFTHYSTIYLHIVMIQAAVRGYQERSWQVFRRECATIIQAASRRFLTRKECHNECMISILIAAAATSLRMRNAARHLQRWWGNEMWKRKQKQAALIIERFFIYVKKEVENEVKALKKKRKERRMRRKMRQSDDWILERAWLNTVEDASVMPEEKPLAHQNYPPPDNLSKKVYTKHDRFTSERMIQSVEDDVQSEVSGLTDLSFGNRHLMGSHARKLKKSKKEIEEDISLEEAFFDSEVEQAKERRRREEEYLRRHGLTKHLSVHSSKSSRERGSQHRGYPGRRYDR